MTILVATLQNLKGFKNVTGKPITTSCGCKTAARESSLGWHSRTLDSEVVTGHPSKSWVLNRVVLQEKSVCVRQHMAQITYSPPSNNIIYIFEWGS
jgi:hypothetical protein